MGPGTSFVGRSADLQQIGALFDGGARVVTLWGAPGIGKTRLALRHVGTLRERGQEACFCELREARSLEDVLDAVARTLDVPRLGASPAVGADQLGQAIAARGPFTLVLDNLEHLIELVGPLVEAWSAVAPLTRLLVTSRALLEIESERPHEVEPLGSEAVDLFVDRALSAGAPPRLLEQQRSAVEQIVERLEGIPLAIELAAGRAVLMPPAEMLARLDRWSSGGSNEGLSLPPGLQLAIDWSWSLLSAVERTALARLSVFHGGFTLDTAQAVVDLAPGPGAPMPLDVFQSLRQKSLIRVHDSPRTGRPRFGLFVTVQAYAALRLAETDDRRSTMLRHAATMLEACEDWSHVFLRHDGLGARARLADEIENLMAIWQRARDGEIDGDCWITRVARATVPMLVLEGMNPTALAILQSALAADPGAADEAWCRTELGRVLTNDFRTREARTELQRAVDTAVSLEDAALEAEARVMLGGTLFTLGAEEDAEAELLRAGQLAIAAQDPMTRFLSGVLMGNLRICQSRLREAREFHEFARRLVPATRSWWAEAVYLTAYGGLLIAEGRFDEAVEEERQAAIVARRGGAWKVAAQADGELAWAHQESGDLAASEAACVATERTFERLGMPIRAATYRLRRAILRLEDGDAEGSRVLLRDVLGRLRGSGACFEEAVAWASLGASLAALDRMAAAEEAFAEADRIVLRDLNPTTTVYLFVQRGHLDLARARRATAAGDVHLAALSREDARRRLERWRGTDPRTTADGRLATMEVRAALRTLSAAVAAAGPGPTARMDPDLAAPPIGGLEIGDDGNWVRMPGGSREAFPKGRALRFILLRLARHRLEAPGLALPSSILIETGWPTEDATSPAATNRLRVALHRLFRGPLGAVLVRRREGWMFDPAIPLVIVSADEIPPMRAAANG